MASRKITLWQIHDDRPGHQNQLRGLTNALAELLPLEVHTFRAPSRGSSLRALWAKKFLVGKSVDRPDLILGAGHSTHLAVLAARRAHGGKAIVLMKPSLPTSLFDLCLIPAHDGVPESSKVITTQGALNVIRPSEQHDQQAGLLLIGGPSGTHSWSDEQMLQQIQSTVSSTPAIRWKLTNSRRTPASFMKLLAQTDFTNLEITPYQDTAYGWLPDQLALAGQVWVSEDSVSMVYESLTSGAAVGVLEVPCKRQGRVAAGMATLVEAGWATRFADWQLGSPLTRSPHKLDEATRCAEIICQRFFSDTLSQAAAG